MTNYQINLFWEEVSQIQQRHSLFFPISQIKFISIQVNGNISKLHFLEGHNLADIITQEIQLTFKLALDFQFV